MIRYSHVSLLVQCKTRQDTDLVIAHLGFQPSQVRENKTKSVSKEGVHAENVSYTVVFNSPQSAVEADPTGRLWALGDLIEPFGERILNLDMQYRRFVDIVYHITPQHPHGITGEFDWFRMPVSVMRRFVAWNLDVSYEAFWFDHPDWVSPSRQGWFKRLSQWIRKRRR